LSSGSYEVQLLAGIGLADFLPLTGFLVGGGPSSFFFLIVSAQAILRQNFPTQSMTEPLSTFRDAATPISTVKIVEKHSAAIRWMHWINFPVLLLMIWSGFMIYWADSATGFTNEHEVYRIGFRSFTLVRLFPPWVYHLLRLDQHQARGLALHALFMWVFTINGVAYALFLAISGQWRFILPDRRSLAHLWSAFRAELKGHNVPPPEHKYNAVQRLAYTLVILMGAGALLTGVAIWKPTSLNLVTKMFGGYQTARWLHFWLTIGFCFFFLVHVLQVLRSGWNNLRSMISGAQIVPHTEPAIGPEPKRGDTLA